MQFMSTLSLVACLVSAAHAATKCTQTKTTSGNSYLVAAEGVTDIPGICGGLWDNLHHSHACEVYGGTQSCKNENGILVWRFGVTDFCNKGHVESAWWEATKNRFGAIHC
ncbi:uncharacterized protein F4812DRAFT_466536 [Daldinia caldariorum]|uniref:uncharacterized protein n=1 Tax=Daldinia caldariorum TaxID=326644 RepID=UPI00200743DE|nr:uncharacterized protein F4812DRAFT_466536 [Daldinia caldariorum]KAI1465027.1 hypothetical protein F4812DRAFT_466536 [Daldinia caldariorum]